MSFERRARLRRWALWPALLGLASGCADFSRGAPGMMETGGTGGTRDGGMDGKGTQSFATDIDPLLSVCANCHVAGGAASTTSLIFTGNAATDYPTVLQFVDTSVPGSSRLLSKLSGNGHGGGTIYASGTPEYQAILSWIQQGAPP
jgi:hypothetical protein